MWLICEFTEDNSVEAVPNSWVVKSEDKLTCMWPTYRNQTKIREAIIKKVQPNENTWIMHQLKRIFSEASKSNK